MKAVASVIMNRVNVSEGEYSRVSQGGNIRNIIFQERQFDCATDNLFGRYNPQNIYNMTPTDIHYYIADWAISGNRLNEIGECLWYLNPFRPSCGSTFPYNRLRNISHKIRRTLFLQTNRIIFKYLI